MHNLRHTIQNLNRNRRLSGQVVEVINGKATVSIAGTRRLLHGLEIVGGPISVGDSIIINYTDGTSNPFVTSEGKQSTETTVVTQVPYVVSSDPDISTPVGNYSGTPVLAFTNLVDVPQTYTSMGGMIVSVKEDETGLEFIESSGSSGGGGHVIYDSSGSSAPQESGLQFGSGFTLSDIPGEKTKVDLDPILMGQAYAYTGTVLFNQTLSGSQATFDLNDIASKYDKIEIKLLNRSTGNSNVARLSFNGDTTASHYRVAEHYFGSSHNSVAYDNYWIGGSNYSGALANSYDGVTITILNPSQSGMLRHAIGNTAEYVTGNSTIYGYTFVMFWESTDPITRITLSPDVGDFASGSSCLIIGYMNTLIATNNEIQSASLSMTGSVSVPQTTAADIAWGAKDWASTGMTDAGLTEITIPSDGIYEVILNPYINTSSDVTVNVIKNTSTTVESWNWRTTGNATRWQYSQMHEFLSGDKIKISMVTWTPGAQLLVPSKFQIRKVSSLLS